MDTPNPLQNQERIVGFLTYIIFLVPMIMQVKTEFTLFHAKQSFLLFIVWIIALVIPFVGSIVSILVGIVSLWCMYQSYIGNKFVIPYLGENMDMILTQLKLIQFFSVK